MIRSVDTVIVGAGQAGLVMSRLLAKAGREHVLVDRRQRLGGGWQDRWDAFRLVSPNWTLGVPGFPYGGPDPDGFMPRDEIVSHWQRYAAVIDAPVELDTEVLRVTPGAEHGDRFEVLTTGGTWTSRSVVVAAGPFGVPHIPPVAGDIPAGILSLHAHHYRREGDLPPGGVLLIGSGQSGVQLAEELMAAGRQVSIAVGHCGRVPRRYRGHDVFWWLRQLAAVGRSVGTPLPLASALPAPAARLACNPQLSGHGGGHDMDLRRMASEGLRLVGRLESFDAGVAHFRSDLNENLHFADTFFEQRLRGLCDEFAARVGGEFPPTELSPFDFEVPEVESVDLVRDGISTVLWTSGYRPSYGWLEFPVLDEFGLPRQERGVTAVPGLAFIGTPWLVDMGSANLISLVRDAEVVAEAVAES